MELKIHIIYLLILCQGCWCIRTKYRGPGTQRTTEGTANPFRSTLSGTPFDDFTIPQKNLLTYTELTIKRLFLLVGLKQRYDETREQKLLM